MTLPARLHSWPTSSGPTGDGEIAVEDMFQRVEHTIGGHRLLPPLPAQVAQRHDALGELLLADDHRDVRAATIGALHLGSHRSPVEGAVDGEPDSIAALSFSHAGSRGWVQRGGVLEQLGDAGTRVVAMRCAGFNNVDLDAARRLELEVVRVPAYSPNAVAEHTLALILALW